MYKGFFTLKDIIILKKMWKVVEFVNETLEPAIKEYKELIGNLKVDLHV